MLTFFERRDLTSVQKGHPSPNDFGETFAFNKTRFKAFFVSSF